MDPIDIIEHSRNVHQIKFKYTKDWSQYFFFCSDNHWDSKDCDRELLKKHFEQAKEREAIILINGDWFDLMQGRYDPRSGKYDIRPEYKHANYIDCVIEDSYEFLKDYVDNIVIIGQGNHETNILKRLETNPTERLVQLLNFKTKRKIFMGGYEGWLKMNFEHVNKCNRFSRNLFYHHGTGGNAPRSKGVLSVDIDQMQHPDADIVIKGHDHNKWHMPLVIRRLSDSCKLEDRKVHHLRLGSYKKLKTGYGWAVEKGFNAPTLGGWFVKFTVATRKRELNTLIEEAA